MIMHTVIYQELSPFYCPLYIERHSVPGVGLVISSLSDGVPVVNSYVTIGFVSLFGLFTGNYLSCLKKVC